MLYGTIVTGVSSSWRTACAVEIEDHLPLRLADVVFILHLFDSHLHAIFTERNISLLHALRSLVCDIVRNCVDNISDRSANKDNDEQDQ